MSKHVPDDERHERGESIPHAGPTIDPAEAGAPRPKFRKLADVLPGALERMDARAEGRELPITTPWADVNEQLPGGGYWPGCHVLVSGTGVGKTTWALQLGLHAATSGAAVAYVGLELEPEQTALRLAAELAGVPWSKAYTGQATPAERQRIRERVSELSALPFTVEFGDAFGWSATDLQNAAARLRGEHPGKRVLLIVDFLQIMSPDAEQRQDLRERIGRAAYAANDVARRFNVCVLLVSSIPRDAYPKVNGLDALGAIDIDADQRGATVVERSMRTPYAIVGLGKESGEIEFSAETVTVAISLPREQGTADRLVVFATAKLRMGRESWCSLRFNGHRFDADAAHGRTVIERVRANGASKRNGKGSAKRQEPEEEFDA